MSAHTVLYQSVIDTVNKSYWDVLVTDDVELFTPGYYQQFPNVPSIYTGSATAKSKSRITIARMIELIGDGVTFELIGDEDMCLIYNILSQFIPVLEAKVATANVMDMIHIAHRDTCEFKNMLHPYVQRINNNVVDKQPVFSLGLRGLLDKFKADTTRS